MYQMQQIDLIDQSILSGNVHIHMAVFPR
ncbi:MAG: hypothetical protein ACD_7C00489G0001, partial [uncultured bacterium]